MRPKGIIISEKIKFWVILLCPTNNPIVQFMYIWTCVSCCKIVYFNHYFDVLLFSSSYIVRTIQNTRLLLLILQNSSDGKLAKNLV